VVAECEEGGVGWAVQDEVLEGGEVVCVDGVELLVEGTEAVDESEDGGTKDACKTRVGVGPAVRRRRWWQRVIVVGGGARVGGRVVGQWWKWWWLWRWLV